MANQVPVGKGPTYFSGPEAAFLIEAASPTVDLTADGELIFKDVSRPDSLNVSTSVTASRSSGDAVPLSNATLLAALTTSLHENNGDVRGEIDWDFSLLNGDVNFLAAGEKLTLTYDITFTDPSGGSATQSVTVTILGVNHPPVFTSGPESASVAELADTTGSATLDTTPTGTLAFTDQDISNTHTVSVSVASETWSGGSGIPAATLADLANALATTLNDSTGTGSGSVNWTFSIPDKDLDFLAQGETLTTVYDVNVSDGLSSATQTVTITAVGANDPVTITSGPESGTVAELPNVTGSSTLDTSAPGSLSFTDVDLSDTHAVAVSLDSAVWSNNEFGVPSQALAGLQSALATTLSDSTGTGSGSVNWTFSIPDQDLDFLAAGETLTATYDVTVSDAAGSSSTQNVVITMTGATDPLVVNPVTNDVSDTAFTDTGTILGGGDLFFDGSASTADLSTALSVTAVNGQAANVDSFVAGTYGDLFVDAGGSYFYVANSSVDPLQVGDNVTDQFTYTVTDSLGRTETATLTFDISGADDAPVITSADAIGSITEDAGPNTVVNGGFETGDLTGWSASSSAISAEFVAIGGTFGNFAADLGPTATTQSLSQNVATTPGQQYTLSFFVNGDPDSSSNALTVTWDGKTILSLPQVPLGFNQYTFNVMGDASASTTPLVFSYADDADGLLLDQVSLNSTTAPATQTAQGNINFSDAEPGDTHVASFQPDGNGYLGTFSLDPVSEVPGSGSVDWHFSVDNSALQFLAQGQTLTQDYTVTITDSHGASTTQDVTIALNGANDPPTAMADNVITDVGANGTSFIPGWALTRNDTDPDTIDKLNVNAVDSSSGGNAFANAPIDIAFVDDSTLGGQFSYDVTDGIAVSNPATVTFNNNAATSTALTGTSGDDIIIGDNAGETLNGGAGNDILIANAGNQTLMGGSGNDIFAFEQAPSSPAMITDFNNTTEQDQIAISASGFGGGLTPGVDLSTLFETSADNQFVSASSLFHFDTANQTLYFSADGTTGSEVALAELQAGPTLQANNLLIVR